jgi:hypothetical protein
MICKNFITCGVSWQDSPNHTEQFGSSFSLKASSNDVSSNVNPIIIECIRLLAIKLKAVCVRLLAGKRASRKVVQLGYLRLIENFSGTNRLVSQAS